MNLNLNQLASSYTNPLDQLTVNDYVRVIESWRSFGLLRNPSFLVTEMKDLPCKNMSKETFFKNWTELTEVLDHMYKDNWDVTFEPQVANAEFNGFKLWVVLRYPEMIVTKFLPEIENNILNNVFVAFEVYAWSDKFILDNFSITRSQVSFHEFEHGFVHPYCQRISYTKDCLELQPFQLERSTKSLLFEHNNKPFDKERTTKFLKSLSGYLRKEAQSAVVPTDDIFTQRFDVIGYYDKEEQYNTIKAGINLNALTYKLKDGKISVLQDEKFVELIRNLCLRRAENLLTTDSNRMWINYQEQVTKRMEQIKDEFGMTPSFMFRDHRVYFNIILSKHEASVSLDEYLPHQDFLIYVCKQIERAINEQSQQVRLDFSNLKL